MIEVGQVWASGERTVRVVETGTSRVVVRDTYGWRRRLTEADLEHGFSVVNGGDHADHVRGVMARRTLADLEPA